ncbi:hypothetical protein [Spiroplasma culicicola]|uniref:N-acetylglucosamine kinase n=1 Tax=Spiroplasma culicicola AES-1 TaxID=1276246 RepID=W6A786_9MOLU|nr:hypothetical protein [Spiroplasma culicicola]AHI53008.1 hypothetical protein SCULI_v1c06670 [Spiroplasma culicicola AES-1]
MEYTLLIDGGATTSKVYLIDSNKNIYSKEIFKGMNLYTNTNESLAELAKINENYKEHNIKNIYLGAPGIHEFKKYEKLLEIFKEKCNIGNIHILTDIEVQEFLFCEHENYLAISLGSGTVMIEKVNESKRIMSSFGPLICDEGSAYMFAKEFIKEAIIEKEKFNFKSKFIKYTLDFFGFKDIEEIKTLYADWNLIKPNFLKFSRYILLEQQFVLTSEINIILEKISRYFFEYIDSTKINYLIKTIYIFGGMVKNEYYRKLLTSGFIIRGFEVIIK